MQSSSNEALGPSVPQDAQTPNAQYASSSTDESTIQELETKREKFRKQAKNLCIIGVILIIASLFGTKLIGMAAKNVLYLNNSDASMVALASFWVLLLAGIACIVISSKKRREYNQARIELGKYGNIDGQKKGERAEKVVSTSVMYVATVGTLLVSILPFSVWISIMSGNVYGWTVVIIELAYIIFMVLVGVSYDISLKVMRKYRLHGTIGLILSIISTLLITPFAIWMLISMISSSGL